MALDCTKVKALRMMQSDLGAQCCEPKPEDGRLRAMVHWATGSGGAGPINSRQLGARSSFGFQPGHKLVFSTMIMAMIVNSQIGDLDLKDCGGLLSLLLWVLGNFFPDAWSKSPEGSFQLVGRERCRFWCNSHWEAGVGGLVSTAGAICVFVG